MWKDFDNRLWETVVEESKSKINYDKNIKIHGSDLVKKNITYLVKNADELTKIISTSLHNKELIAQQKQKIKKYFRTKDVDIQRIIKIIFSND